MHGIQYDVTIIEGKSSKNKYILRKQKNKTYKYIPDQIDNRHQHKYQREYS